MTITPEKQHSFLMMLIEQTKSNAITWKQRSTGRSALIEYYAPLSEHSDDEYVLLRAIHDSTTMELIKVRCIVNNPGSEFVLHGNDLIDIAVERLYNLVHSNEPAIEALIDQFLERYRAQGTDQ